MIMKRLMVVAIVAMVAAVVLLLDSTPVAADPPEDDIGRARHAVYVDGHVEDSAGLMFAVSSGGATGASAVQATGQINPWGCNFHRDNPHESTFDPGPGYAQAKARIECSQAPPPHVATIWQELSKWEGANFTIEAVKTSICPAGTGGPACHPTLDDGVLMQAYINAPCEIGATKRYVHMAYATMTVDGITYASRLDGRRADVNCTGS